MSRTTVVKKLGTTHGVAASTCSRDLGRAEQLYVNLVDSDQHPIRIDAWVGYSSVAWMDITRRQATELIALLATAVAETERAPKVDLR